MDSLGLQEYTEYESSAGERSLQPEDVAPSTEGYNDTSDERA